jgi:UDP-2-acetamido-3-amino-2,3-dideoxy-glucuronate N-acetyltransferase
MSHFAHEKAVVDEGCQIGKGAKIWQFSHIMSNCVIGEKYNIGQNLVISQEPVPGKNVKIQNNVSLYTGVTCDDDVFIGPFACSPMLSTHVPRSTEDQNTPKPMWAKAPQ